MIDGQNQAKGAGGLIFSLLELRKLAPSATRG